MDIKQLMKQMAQRNASDLFFRSGGQPRFKIDGKVIAVEDKVLSVDEVMMAVDALTTKYLKDKFKENLDVDFALYLEGIDRRFRVNIFMQRNWPSIVIRCVSKIVQSFEELNLPAEVLRRLSLESRGLVLLTGTMGSGKSTTIASMIDYINNNSKKHIITIEDPIEFAFEDKNCVINQREIGLDVTSYPSALHAFTLQSPDVMFIGNIRDSDTMFAAITAAEMGVLVLSTLHTVNASQSIERIINFFPPHQHQEIKNQLSSFLKGVISLRLVPLKEGSGRIPAYEVMLLTPTIGRLIREGKIWEIPRFIEEGGVFGMQTFSQSLIKLVKDGLVSEEDAAEFSDNKDEFILSLRGIKKT